MYMRLAGCVAGIVGVLGWEAAVAAVHPTLDLKAAAPRVEVDNPLVALSEGVMAAPAAPAVHHTRERTWSFVTPQRVQQSCSVAAVSCGQPIKEDASVAPVSASPAACKGSGPG
jgi:hypothetical protein